MSPRLHIRLLGDFTVEQDGAPVTLPTRKTAALLAILAMPPGALITRERLADLLWSRSAEAQARGSLRQAVAQLRKSLEDDSGTLIQAVGPGLRLASPGVEVDAVTLEQALSAGSPADLALAERLYRGEFLAGLTIEEALFEYWRATEAERLRRRLLRGLQALLAHHVDRGDLEASLDLGERLVRLEPLAEETYQALMRLHLSGAIFPMDSGPAEPKPRQLRQLSELARTSQSNKRRTPHRARFRSEVLTMIRPCGDLLEKDARIHDPVRLGQEVVFDDIEGHGGQATAVQPDVAGSGSPSRFSRCFSQSSR